MKKKDKLIVIRITTDMFDKLTLIAEKKDSSKSEVVRGAIAKITQKPD